MIVGIMRVMEVDVEAKQFAANSMVRNSSNVAKQFAANSMVGNSIMQ